MARVYVVLTYDLATPPGMQPRFKEEMQKRNWRYSHNGKDLPETTCFAIFTEGISKEDALVRTKGRLGSVSALLQKEDKGFKVNRSMIFAIDEDHFDASIMDVG